MDLSTIVKRFLLEERNVAVLLSTAQVEAMLLAAVSFYVGFADLEQLPSTKLSDIKLSVSINAGEWAQIRSLFLLYVERETALQIEATGMQGVTGYGRNSSEVNNDILNLERDLPQLVSTFQCMTIGGDQALSKPNEIYNFPYGFYY